MAGLSESPLEHLIGNTPLVRIERCYEKPDVEIWAKLEGFNPGGSVKDRPALSIVKDAERRGLLSSKVPLVDATSGNTGIAYAMLAAAKGFPVRLFLPESASPERKRILKAYGARLTFTDPLEGTDGAIHAARQLVAKDPKAVFYADQYSNPANPRAHYDTTAVEIWKQTHGRLTHFVAGLGTSGTFVGTGKRLRELGPRVRLISFQPDGPMHGIEGLKHMPTAIVPAIYDPALAHENLSVATEEAQEWTRRLARDEGLLCGVSSGAAMAGAVRIAKQRSKGLIVTVFPDGGDKYLSERFWEEGA